MKHIIIAAIIAATVLTGGAMTPAIVAALRPVPEPTMLEKAGSAIADVLDTSKLKAGYVAGIAVTEGKYTFARINDAVVGWLVGASDI
jgi:hypothetical protein